MTWVVCTAGVVLTSGMAGLAGWAGLVGLVGLVGAAGFFTRVLRWAFLELWVLTDPWLSALCWPGRCRTCPDHHPDPFEFRVMNEPVT